MMEILGMGMISCLGNNKYENFENMIAGVCGNKKIEKFDLANYDLHYGYEIINNELKNTNKWLIHSIDEALLESNSVIDSETIIIVGTGLRNFKNYEESVKNRMDFEKYDLDYKKIILDTYPDVKDVICISNACSSSLYALLLGMDMINAGYSKKAVICGVDSIVETMFALADRVNQMKPEFVNSFDKFRMGTLMGDGAATIVLGMRNNHSDEKIIVEKVVATCDAFHETRPCEERIEYNMREALRQANISPSEVDLIMTHGTGTIQNDRAEGISLSNIYQNCSVKVSGLKSMIGHTSGASGIMNVIIASLCLKNKRTVPFPHLNTPIEEVEKLDLETSSKELDMCIAQVNAFGFGGLNAVVIIKKI